MIINWSNGNKTMQEVDERERKERDKGKEEEGKRENISCRIKLYVLTATSILKSV